MGEEEGGADADAAASTEGSDATGGGWSSEWTAVECRELQATAMCVERSGAWALLAGRRALALVSLERLLDQQQQQQGGAVTVHARPAAKYDVGACEWSRRDSARLALSVNQRVELLDVGSGAAPRVTSQLQAHTRVVTDVSWHARDPHVLASCSADTWTHVWDVRDARRPAVSLRAVAEAAQVRWNAARPSLLATAHDGDVKVWDERSPAQPLHYIAAHLAHIHGLQWAPPNTTDHQELATCSQDGTVKLWDVGGATVGAAAAADGSAWRRVRPRHCVATSQPVWRVRYTPFGRGLVTVVLAAACAQLQRRDHSLLLWNMRGRQRPQHTFVGHEDVVLEFDWRPRHGDAATSADHQLVTWSKDGTLRVWRVDSYLQKLCGGGGQTDEDAQAAAPAPPSSEEEESTTRGDSLQRELSLLEVHDGGGVWSVLEADAAARTCTVRAEGADGEEVLVRVSFPITYPQGVVPHFTVSPSHRVDLVRLLGEVARDRCERQHRTCLEPCLRRLALALDATPAASARRQRRCSPPRPSQVSCDRPAPGDEGKRDRSATTTSTYGSYSDTYVPFPRTCGARFCSVDTLVCYSRAANRRREQTSAAAAGGVGSSVTPRAYSALAAAGHLTISSYYYGDKRSQRTATGSGRGGRLAVGRGGAATVSVYSAAGLFPLSRALGERYRLDGPTVAVCRHNATVAASLAAPSAPRPDLVHAWRTAELAARFRASCARQRADDEEADDVEEEEGDDETAPWTHHPFGRRLVRSLIAHYAQRGDLQTAAVLACVFGGRQGGGGERGAQPVVATPVYHTVGGGGADVACTAESWSLAQRGHPLRRRRRRLSLDGERGRTEGGATAEWTRDEQRYKLAYAEVLHRWGLLYARANLLKYVTPPSSSSCAASPQPPFHADHQQQQHVHRGVQFVTECWNCGGGSGAGTGGSGAHCAACGRRALRCCVCRVSVAGSANFCLVCGHGGHTLHMRHWFASNRQCATGCGCRCLAETAALVAAH